MPPPVPLPLPLNQQPPQQSSMIQYQSPDHDEYLTLNDDFDDESPPLPAPLSTSSSCTSSFITPPFNVQDLYVPPADYTLGCTPPAPPYKPQRTITPLQPARLSNDYSSPQQPGISPTINSVPHCFPVEGKKRKDKKPSLSSLEINKENLVPCETVLKKYPSLCQENVIGKMASKGQHFRE